MVTLPLSPWCPASLPQGTTGRGQTLYREADSGCPQRSRCPNHTGLVPLHLRRRRRLSLHHRRGLNLSWNPPRRGSSVRGQTERIPDTARRPGHGRRAAAGNRPSWEREPWMEALNPDLRLERGRRSGMLGVLRPSHPGLQAPPSLLLSGSDAGARVRRWNEKKTLTWKQGSARVYVATLSCVTCAMFASSRNTLSHHWVAILSQNLLNTCSSTFGKNFMGWEFHTRKSGNSLKLRAGWVHSVSAPKRNHISHIQRRPEEPEGWEGSPLSEDGTRGSRHKEDVNYAVVSSESSAEADNSTQSANVTQPWALGEAWGWEIGPW